MGDDNTYFDNQNLVKKIDRIWAAFSGEIETYRSFTTRESLIGLRILSDANVTNAKVKGDINAQESYCNCFYRLLGLPVISDGGLYNPGYSPEQAKEDPRKQRYNIANLIPQRMKDLMLQREIFAQDQIQKFASQDENAAAISLVLATHIPATFNPMNENTNPLEPDTQVVTYGIPETIKQLLQGKVTISGVSFQRLIKPFFTDPRADFLVQPNRSQIAIPFLTDAERQANNAHVRPLIEKVCRVRFTIGNSADAGVDFKKAIEEIKNDSSFTEKTLVKITGNIGSYFQSDDYIQRSLFNLIDTVTDVLADSFTTIGKVTHKINWIPKPSRLGATDGFSTTPFPQNTEGQTDLERRLSLIKMHSLNAKSEFNMIQRQLGGSAFSEIDSVVFGGLIQSIPTIYEDELTRLEEEIGGEAKRAEEALKNIAIITGSTLGLGLLDMLAVYTALWTIPKAYLADMLDDDSFARMYEIPQLRSEHVEARRNGRIHAPLDVLTTFETKVREILDYSTARFQKKHSNI